jgi:hypothetical protein
LSRLEIRIALPLKPPPQISYQPMCGCNETKSDSCHEAHLGMVLLHMPVTHGHITSHRSTACCALRFRVHGWAQAGAWRWAAANGMHYHSGAMMSKYKSTTGSEPAHGVQPVLITRRQSRDSHLSLYSGGVLHRERFNSATAGTCECSHLCDVSGWSC